MRLQCYPIYPRERDRKCETQREIEIGTIKRVKDGDGEGWRGRERRIDRHKETFRKRDMWKDYVKDTDLG